jgi:hypothetical protein
MGEPLPIPNDREIALKRLRDVKRRRDRLSARSWDLQLEEWALVLQAVDAGASVGEMATALEVSSQAMTRTVHKARQMREWDEWMRLNETE